MIKPRIEVRFPYQLRQAFKKKKLLYKPLGNEFLLNHARSGLLLALRALQLPPHSKVGMMAYNCHTVMNSIVQAEYDIIFIDVDNHLRIDHDDLREKSNGLSALIITHLFGIINDVETIQQQYPKLIIIEDCAHAYGKKIQGDFGVYSIGMGKLPSLGDGGILIVNNKIYYKQVEYLYKKLPSYTEHQETRLYFKLLATSIFYNRMLYGWFTFHLKSILSHSSTSEKIDMKQMSHGIQAMYVLAKETINDQISTRQKNTIKETSELQGNPLILDLFHGENDFMLVAYCTNPDKLKKLYLTKKIETGTHFANCINWAKSLGYTGDCPNTEKLVSRLLMIPIYQ